MLFLCMNDNVTLSNYLRREKVLKREARFRQSDDFIDFFVVCMGKTEVIIVQ